MYIPIAVAQSITWKNGATSTPILTMQDKSGGTIHLVKDDGCIVLMIEKDDGRCAPSAWWPPEVLLALSV